MAARSHLRRHVCLTVLALAILVPIQSATAQPPAPSAVIDPAVLRAVAATGAADYFVVLSGEADLSGASAIADWDERGWYVYDTLTSHATKSQAGLIASLQAAGVRYTPYWIVNAVQVTSGPELLNQLAAQREVKRIAAPTAYTIPDPEPAAAESRIAAVEWNIAAIGAPLVWSTYASTGAGIVVATIDTGVQVTHTALQSHYRGFLGGSSFDHNYNWYDPASICGSPSLVPCDNNGHGTQVMGVMVGDDGGGNQIGVAPGARFISAKGCESSSCSIASLLAAAQWILAPTRLDGTSPNPSLRPHVVNNSWGGSAGDLWYQASVQAWVASGIFPAFTNGSSGPGCGTAVSPGDYVESYSTGYFDFSGAIGTYSSRGPSLLGGSIKPNVAAPGGSIRTSGLNNTYVTYTGPSYASPHTAATVALMWSAVGAIARNVPMARDILDISAVDVTDLTCGGTPVNNNVWGQGKLDAYTAVSLARSNIGQIQGTVSSSATGLPIASATVHAAGPVVRDTLASGAGLYTFPNLPPGTYTVQAGAFGYLTVTATGVTVVGGALTTQDFALTPLPTFSVSGIVRDAFGQPVLHASVSLQGAPLPVVKTDASGHFALAGVPAGVWSVVADSPCGYPAARTLTVGGNVTGLDFVLPLRMDGSGYTCRVQAPAYIEATTVQPLSGDDVTITVALPFSFPYYQASHTTAYVCANGYLNFLLPNCVFGNVAIPSTGAPNGAIYAFWDDLYVDSPTATLRTRSLTGPNRYVIEWRNVSFFGDATRRVDFEIVLHEDGQILTQYRNIADDGRERGNSATLGMENASGTDGLRYSYNQASIVSPGFAVMYKRLQRVYLPLVMR